MILCGQITRAVRGAKISFVCRATSSCRQRACRQHQGMTELERFPVSFKSTVGGQCYRHIVLAIKVDGKFGAMGLSRRSTLMFKDFTYASFGDLIVDFRDAYEECFHRLLTVNTGLPISHNDYRAIPIVRCRQAQPASHTNWLPGLPAVSYHGVAVAVCPAAAACC